MTRKYWAGIFVAMMAVFAFGMVVAKGVHTGKKFVNEKLALFQLMGSSGFRVDGDQIGDIQRLQFMRTSPGDFDSAVVTVKIDSPADVDRISSCTLRATEAYPFGSGTRFKCTSHADSANLDLMPFGHIEILPAGKQVPFYVAQSVYDKVRAHAYRGPGNQDSGDVDVKVMNDTFSISVNGQELVRASEDSNGGSFVLRDSKGQPIVEINGDSTNPSVRINNAAGRKVIDIHGPTPKKDSARKP